MTLKQLFIQNAVFQIILILKKAAWLLRYVWLNTSHHRVKMPTLSFLQPVALQNINNDFFVYGCISVSLVFSFHSWFIIIDSLWVGSENTGGTTSTFILVLKNRVLHCFCHTAIIYLTTWGHPRPHIFFKHEWCLPLSFSFPIILCIFVSCFSYNH